MGSLPLHHALSTPSAMGMVLKPREFQRIMLNNIGERGLADELDANGRVFGPSSEIDHSIDVDPCAVLDALKQLLCALGLVKKRSIATPMLVRRTMIIGLGGSSAQPPQAAPAEADSFLKKLSAAYNGYRSSLIKKAADIQRQLVIDPQLRTEVFGGSMAKAFAGGIDKTSASVLGPESLAYLTGVHYQDRDFHLNSDEAVESLAQTGVFVGATA
ncbi:MAG: hypothetical protein LUQ37_09585, partial [Methanoregulaceae archaeon]|jgi:hypothetical protein|nr:hypothetical protein [Methanoregulaceae archaeon]